MKKFILIITFWCFYTLAYTQEVSLTNSGTLFDSFENPAQQAFILNDSRKYSFNFLFPSIHNQVYFDGDANIAFKTLLFKNDFNFPPISNLGEARLNHINFNTNTYLLMFKIFNTIKYNKELGFALQLRTTGNISLTNETFALFNQNFQLNNSQYNNPFNGYGSGQAYSQLSVTYRQNYDKKWAWGGKFSILNGIAYAKGEVSKSSLTINREKNILTASFLGNGFSSVDSKPQLTSVLPNFKNPGASISAGANYKSKDGYFFSGTIKDLGFIAWNNNGLEYTLDDTMKVYNAINSGNIQEKLIDKFGILIKENAIYKKKVFPTQAKIEVFASKKIDFYTPNLVISKSVFDNDFFIAAVNNFKYQVWNFGLNGIYTHLQGFNIGSQVMLQSPNVEFYVGSEKLMSTKRFISGYSQSDPTIGNNPTKSDFYLGFSLKFGRKMQHFSMADEIPFYDEVIGPKKSFNPFNFLKKKNKNPENKRPN